jgi:NitT/TauT family transport system permease protein
MMFLEEKSRMKTSSVRTKWFAALSVLFMLVTWKILAMIMHSEYVLPAPEIVAVDLYKIIFSAAFIKAVLATVSRGLLGFSISLLLAIIIGIFAGLSVNTYAFVRPILIVFRSTPVITFILLALIWFSNQWVPVFIAIITMFPVICLNVIEGIRNVDRQLVEMAAVYRVERPRIIRELYIPSIVPFLFSGMSTAFGFGWRAIIIGEVLSQPEFGIGTRIEYAHAYLMVGNLIAWTIAAVLISYLFDKIIRLTERSFVHWK